MAEFPISDLLDGTRKQHVDAQLTGSKLVYLIDDHFLNTDIAPGEVLNIFEEAGLDGGGTYKFYNIGDNYSEWSLSYEFSGGTDHRLLVRCSRSNDSRNAHRLFGTIFDAFNVETLGSIVRRRSDTFLLEGQPINRVFAPWLRIDVENTSETETENISAIVFTLKP